MTSENYRIHDLVVRSELALSLPPSNADVEPDVEVVLADHRCVGEDAPDGRLVAVELMPPFSFYIVDTNDGFILRYGITCDLAVAADGSHIEIAVDPRRGDQMASVILTAGGLAFAAMRKGHVMFHASGIALDGRAVITLGDAGTGKTTLAAELAFAGAIVLADDAIRVDIGEQGPIVFPGSRILRLRERSATGLREYVEQVSGVERAPDGRIAVRSAGEAPARCDLAAVFVTCPDEGRKRLEFERLDMRQALIEAVRHVRTAGFVDGTYLVDHFSFSSRLVQQVPFYRVTRPPRPLPPAEVRAQVDALLCR